MKIRINQDVTFNWKLTVEGESVDLSKLELSVEITTPSNKKVEITPNIQFDTLEFNYRPKQVGEYILSAYLNRFKDGETALDIKAFEGVKYSWNQDFSNDDNLAANYVELEGNLNYGYKLDINKITYTDLVKLRDTSKLTSGRFYQITDYVTTTTQTGTKSAGHPFDVIVLALSESELSEQAWAIQHDGDTYFADCNLNAWQIWYSLDNDTTRFGWADSYNGKGVIYRMIDEWNNDVPYDFKNIIYNGSWGYWAYTFNWINDNSDNSCEDLSISQYAHRNGEGSYSHTCDNVIDACENGIKLFTNSFPLKLNACVFLNNYISGEGVFQGCFNNTFGKGCFNNTLGHSCVNNTFGGYCYNNTFGRYCSYNSLGSNCNSNTFNNNCYYNTFGLGCKNNYLAGFCYRNTFGINCNNNYVCEQCFSNSFKNECSYIKFSPSSSVSNGYYYYQFNNFGEGCQYILFKGAETASSKSQVQNYNFAQGLQGTSDNYLIVEGKRGRAYETKVAKNSNGELKIYCEADLIQ